MGNRRLGRKRLYAVEKLGQSVTRSDGPAVSSSIGNITQFRDGSMITTEITVDLAGGSGMSSEAATAGKPQVIGFSSSAGSHTTQNAQLCQITRTDAIDFGVVAAGEMVAVEAVAGGGEHIGLIAGTALSASQKVANSGGDVTLISTADHSTVGRYDSFTKDQDLNGKYLYLVHTGSGAGAYSGGKVVIRLFGYDVFADVE